MKTELEEAAERYAEGKSSSSLFQEDHKKDFIAGANYQAERMYSEQEVLQLLLRLQQTESYDNLYEWFEQFKKK
jgi:hypothetical protein